MPWFQKQLRKPLANHYRKHAEAIDKIDAPVSGILGNHDLTYGYDILKDKVKFVEKEKKVPITGKRGLEFILKGDLNIIECPPIYAKLAPLLEKNFIPYHSGYSLSELSKAENTLQKILSESPNDRLENIRKGEKPEYSDEQLQLMEKQLKGIQELRPKVLEYNQSERRRLGDKTEADIYLTHKLPSCKKARPDIDGSLSDVTTEYAANTNAVYGGHFHDGQIGYKTIDNFLKQESTEKTVIDGVEVPVYYLDENEPWELNPGTKYFFVTEYDTNKEIEQVVIHEFYYEEAA